MRPDVTTPRTGPTPATALAAIAAVVALVALPAGGATLRAQGAPGRSIAIGGAAAAVLPTDALDERSGAGYGLTVVARTPLRRSPPLVSWRAELGWAAFRGTTLEGPTGLTARVEGSRVLSAALAVQFTNPRGLAWESLRPYAVAGVGAYHLMPGATRDAFGAETSPPDATRVGVTAGIGLAFPLGDLSAFVEGRLHNVLDERARYVAPISFGLTF